MKSIQLEDHEALVLFDFLQREIDANNEKRLQPLLDHPAEFWALNTVLIHLESLLAEPFRTDYDALVEAARNQVMAECDPEGAYIVGGGR